MPSENCAAVGFFNNTKKLRAWKNEICATQNISHEQLTCGPSVLRNNDQRNKGINPNNSAWQPKLS